MPYYQMVVRAARHREWQAVDGTVARYQIESRREMSARNTRYEGTIGMLLATRCGGTGGRQARQWLWATQRGEWRRRAAAIVCMNGSPSYRTTITR